MIEALKPLSQFIGTIVIAGGGISLIVYQFFKHLATKWLDSKFKERLQSLKHEHERELEQLRFKISALLDRTVKLHQREFDVLPEAWSKLNDAFWTTRSLVFLLKEIPDIERMPPAQREEFISKCGLHEWEKTELRETSKKNDYYFEHISWHNLHDAQTKARDAYVFTLKNGIFIGSEIRQKFDIVYDLIKKALFEEQEKQEEQMNQELKRQGIPVQRDDIKKFNSEGDGLMKDLEGLVHERLWPKDTA